MPAFPNAAFHPSFKVYKNIFVRYFLFLQYHQYEFVHDRRSADKVDRFCQVDPIYLIYQCRYNTNVAVPTVMCNIDGFKDLNAVDACPSLKLVMIDALGELFGSLKDRDLSKVCPVVHDIVDHRSLRNKSDPAADEYKVLAFHLVDGVSGTERPPDTELIAGLHLVHDVGYPARFSDDHVKAGFCWRR